MSQDGANLARINARLGELLDEVAALLVWVLQFSEDNGLSANQALGHYIKRIRVLLSEIGHPPSEAFTKRIITSRHDKRPPEKLPVYP